MTTSVCEFTGSAADFLPDKLQLPLLAKAATKCHGCELYCHATQVVFGEGPKNARVIVIGEQPGDQEDLAGKPFVGPAGRILDEALIAAGITRKDVYVTNAVKHFKFVPRGKRRQHSKPSSREIAACRPWLVAELQAIKPEGIILLGATASQSLLGNKFKVTQHRGEILRGQELTWTMELETPPQWALATVHPSSLLRIPDQEARRAARAQFAADMALARQTLSGKTNR